MTQFHESLHERLSFPIIMFAAYFGTVMCFSYIFGLGVCMSMCMPPAVYSGKVRGP